MNSDFYNELVKQVAIELAKRLVKWATSRLPQRREKLPVREHPTRRKRSKSAS